MMKFLKLFSAVAVMAFLCSGSFAADAGKYVEGSCCAKAAAKGKKCTHPCCVEAEKEGKVCAKCNKEKKQKKQSKE